MKDLRHGLQHGLKGKAEFPCGDWVSMAKRVDVEVPDQQIGKGH